jgi:hypothetical protein
LFLGYRLRLNAQYARAFSIEKVTETARRCHQTLILRPSVFALVTLLLALLIIAALSLDASVAANKTVR